MKWRNAKITEDGHLRLSEAQLQKQCVKIFDNKYPAFSHLFFHVANGGTRNVIEATQFKYMGVRKGIPDLMLPIPVETHIGLAIEMKAKGGKTSPEQKRALRDLESFGWYVIVVDSADLFEKTIDLYMAEVYKKHKDIYEYVKKKYK